MLITSVPRFIVSYCSTTVRVYGNLRKLEIQRLLVSSSLCLDVNPGAFKFLNPSDFKVQNSNYYLLFILRLTREYEKLKSGSLPDGVTLSLPLNSNIFTWEAKIDGPKASLYEGVVILYVCTCVLYT